jgi:hypothetical protein
MAVRAEQMDDFVVRLEKQVWATWLPVVAPAALALGFVLGTWFASVPKVASATPSTVTLQQKPIEASPQLAVFAASQRRLLLLGQHFSRCGIDRIRAEIHRGSQQFR